VGTLLGGQSGTPAETARYGQYPAMKVIERWVVVRQWREEMEYRAPEGMEAVIRVMLRSGEELTPVRIQVVGDHWVAFHTFASDVADIEIVCVMESEIAEVRCRFDPKGEQPFGFTVEAISVETGESESSVTVDRF
jgi:hypothetical protein